MEKAHRRLRHYIGLNPQCLTLGAEYDLFKRLILIQKDYPRQEELYEKDISAEQY
jgi:hypothetical protein